MRKALLAAIVLAFVSCSKDEPGTDVPTTSSVKDFTWKAMNSWYNWQESVPNLADSKDDDINSYNNYLNSFSTPQALFKSLKHPDDDFSWFIEDYVAQQQQFQGISKSFGFRPSLVRVGTTDFVVMYIQYVSENSPADKAGFKRGDIINGINDKIMTTANYESILDNDYSQETAKFNFVENDGTTAKENKSITKEVVSDNPVHLVKTFDNINGKKVGYLVYNGFRSSYNDELNTAFADLKSAGIQELILDLRINGGGSVLTSAYLASMIHGEEPSEKEVFAELRYNSKHTDRNARAPFFDRLNVYDSQGNKTGEQNINRLTGITKLYVLASGSTASASEMIINGLRPFIDVVIVGTKTTGKNEGSITLYDSPSSDFTDVNSANSEHKNAMQPIVFQIYNNLGQSDYNEGFEPNIEIEEFRSWNNILPFGDENEVVLKAALDNIRGISTRSVNNLTDAIELSGIKKNRFDTEMYIDHDFISLTK